MADSKIRLKLTGRETKGGEEKDGKKAAELPPLLRPTLRSSGLGDDPFLPEGYLQPTGSFDVGAGAREGGDARTDVQSGPKAPGEIVVLELADGSTLITSAGRLQDSLRRARPDLLGGEDDEILLEKLRAEGAAARGLLGEAAGGLVSKVYTLVAGDKPDGIVKDALAGAGMLDPLLLGVSWLGTKALMQAIENKLPQPPGLYRWDGASELHGLPKDFAEKAPVDAATGRPLSMLVFVHGTGSSTFGSFGELRNDERAVWAALRERYGERIYAFEHRTLSQSPIRNALDLVAALPPGARISLVSHSRGGLVADLLCLTSFDGQIDRYKRLYDGLGDAASATPDLRGEVDQAYAEHRDDLRALAEALGRRRPVVQRYVRIASPANGTRLASANFDVFLSGLLTLIGQVPFFFGSLYYSAFKRVVIEIARNRTDPHLVPGIEAMLPDSPMARLLHDAPVQPGIDMAVIAGDIEGGSLLRRLGVLLSDFLLFDNEANDLVVDTPAMLAGVAAGANARVLFDRGSEVSHFRYFVNDDTRVALRDWLVAEQPRSLDLFAALPAPDEFDAALEQASARSRDATAAERPVVVVLPGVMGSTLTVGDSDRVWFDLPDLVDGGLDKLRAERPGVAAGDLIARSYGRLCETLSRSHRVERFAYDWRLPLDVLAERLGGFLDKLMRDTQQPIRLLAHSMGGLVVRACIHKRRPLMDELMARPGARLVLLGTPNQGAHSMVENLLGKGDMLRTLVVLDLRHGMQEVLDIVAGFRGVLQLLPRPGFQDTFQQAEQGSDGSGMRDYLERGTWETFGGQVRDPWFGDGHCALPEQDALDAASWLWQQDEKTLRDGRPSLPADYEKKSIYVFGVAPNTPCGVRVEPDRLDRGKVRLRMVGTALGDGTVTWESGRMHGIGGWYYMPAAHGDLASTVEHFDALVELLASGSTARLATTPPALRAVEQPQPRVYDAGPPTLDDPVAAEHKVMGAALRSRLPARSRRKLEVRVRADDLRFLSVPVMVGHYEQDPIAGPEALIDRELLDGELSQRHSLGLYAGACGTATVVLRAPNGFERARGSLSGAVVTGFGRYDGALSVQTLTEAVRTGVLRYLLQVIDVLGKDDRELPLATLLLGFNSSASLSVQASVDAVVTGTIEANTRFAETTRLNIRVARLDIVEIYLDTAITAVYSLRRLEAALLERAKANHTALVVHRELVQGDGLRQRLFDNRDASYWPRLIVTDADRNDGRCPPECYEAQPVGPAGAAVPRTRLADRLRFLYVGQRARAESVVQQRQPGLVEALVRQQIHLAVWQPDFGRMLFQLMVPPDFKDAARQLERVVLVVDSATANLPWELMLADDPAHVGAEQRPLALRTAVVRQLASSRFRRQVRHGSGRQVLVIGNPSVEGFGACFPASRPAAAGASADAAAAQQDPPDLPGAEAEAREVVVLLDRMGYDTRGAVIGAERSASEVLAALYRQPYRILHISGHGVFDLLHADGRRRSGVVLSGGLLITAAEIDAMETVPELVFLNCCHLGQIDSVRDGNRLAASVARELIEIGVRCVVVAGWAVNDVSARHFAQAFYERLLLQRRLFGQAVFEARTSVWQAFPSDITWGAFQAYGDAGWRVDPRTGDGGGSDDDLYASLDELLDELARTRARLSRKRERQSERDIRLQVQVIEDRLKKRCPPNWLALPHLQSALGATWRDLDRLESARDAFRQAVQAEDKAGRVPIRDIEQLAGIESRLGAKRAAVEFTAMAAAARQKAADAADAGAVKAAKAGKAGKGRAAVADAAPDRPPGESALELIALALSRLDGLDAVVAAAPGATAAVNGERSALRGGAFKRKALYHAYEVLHAEADAPRRAEAAQAMNEALQQAVAAYRLAEGDPAGGSFLPYSALNRLALDALTAWSPPSAQDAAVALAEQCRKAVTQSYAREANPWDALMQPEAVFVQRLLDGSLAKDADAGQRAVDEVANAYAESLLHTIVKPSQLDSVASHMEVLAYLHLAQSVIEKGRKAAEARRVARHLFDLARRVQPGRRSGGGELAPEEAAIAAATGEVESGEPLPSGDKRE